MSRVKYQHYVPRFYLEGFQSSSFKLWCYDKVADKAFQQSPESLGGERLFYDLPEAEKEIGVSQFLEKWFVPLETDAARTLKTWLDRLAVSNMFSPSQAEMEVMAQFIAVQELRTPNARQSAVAATELALKISFFNHLGEKEPELASKIGNPIEDLEIKLPKERWGYAHATSIMDVTLIEEMADILLKHIWVVANNTTRSSNYTSDHPIVRHSHAKHPVLKMRGLRSRGIQIVYPLSPRYSLHIVERTFWRQLEPLHGKLFPKPMNEDNVQFDNAAQVGESNRFVYCRDDDFNLARELCKSCPELRDPERPALVSEPGTGGGKHSG